MSKTDKGQGQLGDSIQYSIPIKTYATINQIKDEFQSKKELHDQGRSQMKGSGQIRFLAMKQGPEQIGLGLGQPFSRQ